MPQGDSLCRGTWPLSADSAYLPEAPQQGNAVKTQLVNARTDGFEFFECRFEALKLFVSAGAR
jgi:hypothetical protein